IAESATLAAIVKSPAHYCPLLFPLSAQKRRNIILQSMYSLGFINQSECENAKKEQVSIHPIQESLEAAYFKEAVRQFVEELVGRHKLYAGGLVIQTTMNYQIQDNAQK